MPPGTEEEMKNTTLIAYSGIPGAYAEIAASKIFPDKERVSHSSFGKVYEAVEAGECDFGVLPIENSFAGDVSQVMDLIYFGSLYVVGVYEMPIRHNLLGVEGAVLSEIKSVYSHPQALDQCAEYIRKCGFTTIAATNTAVAALDVSKKNDPSLAAIASAETASRYGLKILKTHINEKEDNVTRFVVVSRDKTPMSPKKEAFSMVFTVKNEAGALARAISLIGENGFNMRAIRSRPAKALAWNYYFFVEGEGDISKACGKKMREQLEDVCETIRFLGNYPADIMLE